eukprot:12184201-Karenia_brevis.AAC.1
MSAMVSFGQRIQDLFNDSPNMQPRGAASVGDAQPGWHHFQCHSGPDKASPCNDSDARLVRLEKVVTEFVEGVGSNGSRENLNVVPGEGGNAKGDDEMVSKPSTIDLMIANSAVGKKFQKEMATMKGDVTSVKSQVTSVSDSMQTMMAAQQSGFDKLAFMIANLDKNDGGGAPM